MGNIVFSGVIYSSIETFGDDFEEFMEMMDDINQERIDFLHDIERMLLQEYVHPDAFDHADILDAIDMFEGAPDAQDILDFLVKMAEDDNLMDIAKIKRGEMI